MGFLEAKKRSRNQAARVLGHKLRKKLSAPHYGSQAYPRKLTEGTTDRDWSSPQTAAAVTKGALKLVWAEEKQREELGREALQGVTAGQQA